MLPDRASPGYTTRGPSDAFWPNWTEPAPDGHTTWTGKLLAKALGDVSAIHVLACAGASTAFTFNGAAVGA